jgi:Flp pilus assembly pilin Flp
MLVLHTMDTLKRFWLDEVGQDLVEYSLLIVFVLIASEIILQQTGSAVVPIWSAGSATVQNAALQVS